MPRLGALVPIIAAFALASCAKPAPTAYAPADYASWRRTTETVLDYPVPGHMDRYRVPRMNAIGWTARPLSSGGARRWDFPEGTVIVKEVYASSRPGPGEAPIMLTLMAKAPKDPRAQGGWLWITRDLPSGEEKVFAGSFCVTCHADANERHPYFDKNPQREFRDYVFFVPETGSGGEGAAP